MITIFHKSNCSTSIKVLNVLKESGKKYKIVELDYNYEKVARKKGGDSVEIIIKNF